MSWRIPFGIVLLGLLLTGCAETRAPIMSTEPAATTASIDWSQAKKVDVILDSFEFSPDRLTFTLGQPYRLHLKNASDGEHNFDAPAFFRSVAMRPDATAKKVKSAGGVLELRPDEEAEIWFVASRPGIYALECSHFLHASFGMTGKIIVR